MSRAFVKDGAPEAPPIIPPRAPLPDGVANYVTPRGLRLLREEREALEAERSRLGASEAGDAAADRKRALQVVAGRLAALSARIARSQLVEPRGTPDAVRFGTTVEAETEAGELRRIQIVGVDEAEPAVGRVAFVSPIARALVGTRVGGTAVLATPQGERRLTVTRISYDAPPVE